jgi:alkylhydroperoxidase family enzyme
VGSRAGLESGKILALGDYAASDAYGERERAALAYADAMTTEGGVGDELFERVRQYFSDDAVVELTALIAWENASSRFNRALQIQAQGLWKGGQG